MPCFSWNDDLSVGNKFIDDDHRALIKLVNELHDAMSQGHGKDILGKTLDQLIHYTKAHFKREEDHMQRINYRGYPLHKQEHDKLIKEVQALKDKFNNGSSMLTVQVSSFLRDWLVNHIMKSDRLLAEALLKAAA
ncbi:MAG: hemerythrin family protein [Burkholderiales bacterium]|nr:hemerythrin family protein [Burkholderiales bacterium]